MCVCIRVYVAFLPRCVCMCVCLCLCSYMYVCFEIAKWVGQPVFSRGYHDPKRSFLFVDMLCMFVMLLCVDMCILVMIECVCDELRVFEN